MAAVPFWQPKTFYAVGALVRAPTVGPVVPVPITNPGLEDGDTLWTKNAPWSIVNTGHKYQGSWSAEFGGTGFQGGLSIYKTAASPVQPGQSVTASCMVDQGAAAAGVARACVVLRWLDDTPALIRVDAGNLITSSQGGWQKSSLTITAPAGAVAVQIGAQGFRDSGNEKMWVDNFAWNLTTPSAIAGLIYENVATAAGYSGGSEPAWPTTVGGTVPDNECIWGAKLGNRVVWEASPLLTTGATEPAWSTAPGNMVVDGNVSWKAETRHITDVNCPHSKVVAIAASHVWAGDKDIVRFSAAANPLDWTTEFDAGYLPTGLQQQGADDVSCLNIYRSNLAVFNNATFQMWQIDPDPAVNALLDQLSGLGTSFQQAAAPVGDELYFLSPQGVRSISVSVGSTNVASGDIGEPIDSILTSSIAITLAQGRRPVGTYFPGAGQYWLALAQ